MSFSPKQVALIERLRGGRLLVGYLRPGTDKVSWYIEAPYSNEDARTVNSLLERGLIRSEGGDLYTLKEDPTPPTTSMQEDAGK